MADIVTGSVSGSVDMSSVLGEAADTRVEGFSQTADIRRDVASEGAGTRYSAALGVADIRREVAGNAHVLSDAVKEAGWANSDRTGTEADRVVGQNTAYYIAAQSQNFANATALAALKASQDAGFARAQADTQIASMQAVAAAQLEAAKTTGMLSLDAAKNAAALALGQANLGAQIAADGAVTRGLIQTLNREDLNRELIERNALIVDERGNGRFWQHGHNAGQFQAVQSQLQAFQSQLQETRQGMVNFGTMAGVGQTSTSNNVR